MSANLQDAVEGGRKRSALTIWIASFYCLGVGVFHAITLITAIYNARDMLAGLFPQWAYVLGFVQPLLRITAGVSIFRRSLHSPAILLVLVAVTVIFPLAWRFYWSSQPGAAILQGPFSLLATVDLLLLLLITAFMFRLKARAALR